MVFGVKQTVEGSDNEIKIVKSAEDHARSVLGEMSIGVDDIALCTHVPTTTDTGERINCPCETEASSLGN